MINSWLNVLISCHYLFWTVFYHCLFLNKAKLYVVNLGWLLIGMTKGWSQLLIEVAGTDFVFKYYLNNKFWALITGHLTGGCLTHWPPHQTVRDPSLISWRFLEFFRASESKKLNHMHSNHRHKIRFQDIVYSKFNKWTAKILNNINRKKSTWCV